MTLRYWSLCCMSHFIVMLSVIMVNVVLLKVVVPPKIRIYLTERRCRWLLVGPRPSLSPFRTLTRRHDIQYNDTQHNDTQHDRLVCDNQHK
jgi:hypothetical protein